MFINVSDELKKARENKYALGAFNTNNLEATKAICAAAEKSGSPIIIQTTPGAIEYAGLSQIFNIIKTETDESGISAAIHLDHAKEFEIAKECIDIGYRSVMIDGSKLPFEENVALTRKVVDYAKPKNVSVEAEIGAIGTGEGGENAGQDHYSSPDEVKRFVDITGIDSVAVSIGNEHGAPEGEKINLTLLKNIAEVVSIPLVLHGASGLSDNEVKAAIELGVTKVNIDTGIRRAFIEGMRDIDPAAKDYREILKISMTNIEKAVEGKIKLFSEK